MVWLDEHRKYWMPDYSAQGFNERSIVLICDGDGEYSLSVAQHGT
jgi:hypothetical protein